MSGSIVSNYGIGDVNFDNLMSTVDAQRIGYHALTLTNYDTTTAPQIAAGSKIEVNGALYKFDSAETITGSPSDGDVYILLESEAGTASGATTDSTGYPVGTTTITLASAGTGTILVGDRVTFGSDTVKYIVTSGDADVSNGGTITIESPGIYTAIPASATSITVYGGAITASYTNTAPTWSDSKQGWYDAGGNKRYCEFIMDKSGSSYSNKRTYLKDPLKKIDSIDINSFLTQSIGSSGYVKIGELYIQWGVDTNPSTGGATQNFSITFPNNCYGVYHSGISFQNAVGDWRSSYPTNVTTSSFDWAFYGTIGTNTVYWYAIGN